MRFAAEHALTQRQPTGLRRGRGLFEVFI
jgi:hypothetical protein